mmetsp:Transcript_13511/g.13715  ORF Transcript_13511/g.13715 Transcript_13511/m.13715 type:complete len:105 (+) Transcript_13511:101-415(+)
MTVQKDTITKLTATDITKWAARPTYAGKKNTQRADKKAAAIKTRYGAFPLGTRFGYTATIMLKEDYIGKVNKINSNALVTTWIFSLTEQSEMYGPAINCNTLEK